MATTETATVEALSAGAQSAQTCERCGGPRVDGHGRYCSRLCRRSAYKARRRARDRAGIPRGPGTTPASPNGWQSLKRRTAGAPFAGLGWQYRPRLKFDASVAPDKRIAVPASAEAQRKAEALIERGCCAYRGRDGLIRELGVPRDHRHRGKVWTAPAPVRVRDSRERALMLTRLAKALGE